MKTVHPRFLVVESESPEDRARRRSSVGRSAGESFAETLRQMAPNAEIVLTAPAEDNDDDATAAGAMDADAIAGFDAVFLGGSPLHVYDDAPPVRRQLAFMRAVFASGTPSFGSCAGLQLAVAAAGGRVRAIPHGREAGIARRITATYAGSDHPLLAGRPAVWDAGAIHGDEVAELPASAVLLAGNPVSHVQAVEIRHDRGVFWGVQYHPELSPGEIGAALSRSADTLREDGIVADHADLEEQVALFDRIQRDPGDGAACWRLGVTADYAEEPARRREIRNFLDHLDQLANQPATHAGAIAEPASARD